MAYTGPKNIFVVDDDLMVTESMKDYLSVNGAHNVTVFSTGEDCLAHLDENPDIIILDYYLNSVKEGAADGMEILQFIKLNYPQIRIIMLSGLEQHKTVEQTVQQGAEKFIYKDQDAFNKIAEVVNRG
jgi:two-component system, OmpR family, response regulator